MTKNASKYSVMIDDNFHYMDEGERFHFRTFPTAEEAVAACRKIVHDWLESHYEPGMTAEKLNELYVNFGEDPFIVPTDYAVRGSLRKASGIWRKFRRTAISRPL